MDPSPPAPTPNTSRCSFSVSSLFGALSSSCGTLLFVGIGNKKRGVSLFDVELEEQLTKLAKKAEAPRQRREHTFHISFNLPEYQLLLLFAHEQGLSPTQYLRMAAMKWGLNQPRSLPLEIAFRLAPPLRKKVVREKVANAEEARRKHPRVLDRVRATLKKELSSALGVEKRPTLTGIEAQLAKLMENNE